MSRNNWSEMDIEGQLNVLGFRIYTDVGYSGLNTHPLPVDDVAVGYVEGLVGGRVLLAGMRGEEDLHLCQHVHVHAVQRSVVRRLTPRKPESRRRLPFTVYAVQTQRQYANVRAALPKQNVCLAMCCASGEPLCQCACSSGSPTYKYLPSNSFTSSLCHTA